MLGCTSQIWRVRYGVHTVLRRGRLIRASGRISAIALLLATGLLSATCGGGTPSAPPPSTPAPPPTPPPPPNNAPAVALEIPDVTMEGDGARTLLLGFFFSDPDGDTLTYAVSTSDPLILTAAVSGTTVTLTPLLDGTAAVRVTATDPGGLSVTQMFHVIIGEAQILASGQQIEEIPTGAAALAYEALSRGSVTLVGDTVTIRLEPPESLEVAAQFADATTPARPNFIGYVAGGWILFASVANYITYGCLSPVPCSIQNGRVTSGSVFKRRSDEDKTTGPRRVGRMEDRTLTVDSDPVEIPIAGYFTDPDRQQLTFKASSSDPEVVKVDVSANTLTIEPLAIGEATIQVTATDSEELSISQTFEITVTEPAPRNRPPVIDEQIPDQVLTERGVDRNLVLSPYFSDPDDDVLRYEADGFDPSILRISVVNPGAQGFIPTLIMDPGKDGTTEVSVTATDPDGLSVTQTFQVTVRNVNRGPFLTDSLTFRDFVLGGDPWRIDLSEVFADPDDDRLTYTYSFFSCESAPNRDINVLTVQITANVMTVTPTEQGHCIMTVTATDPGGLSWSDTVFVTVEGPPRITASIPDLKLPENARLHTLDLSLYFIEYDVGEVPKYSATSDNPEVVAIGGFGGAQGNELILHLLSNGTATVTVTAADETGSVTQSFTVMVGEPNRPPEVIRIPDDVTIFVGEVDNLFVNPAALFEDPDEFDVLTTQVRSDSPHIRLGHNGLFHQATGVSAGTATIVVTASDGELMETLTFAVTVLHNDPPRIVSEIPDQMLPTNEQRLVELSIYFEDPNTAQGDRLTYFARSSDAGVVEAEVSGRELVLGPQSVGSATITVTAYDRGQLTAEQSLTVTVGSPGPAMPTGLHVSDSGVLWIEWSWDAVEGASEYEIEFTIRDPHNLLPGERLFSLRRTVRGTSFRIEGFVGWVRVRSVVGTDSSQQSSPWTRWVKGAAIIPPRTPENLRVTDTGDDFIVWSWDDVPDADGYEFQIRRDGNSFTRARIRFAARTSVRMTGLSSGTEYFLRVRSIADMESGRVESSWSTPVRGVTIESEPLEDFHMTISGDRGTLEICVRDWACEDGDLVDVYFDGRAIFQNHELFNDWRCRNVDVQAGLSYRIELQALNDTQRKCGRMCGFSCTPGGDHFSPVNSGEIRITGANVVTQRWEHGGGAGSSSSVIVRPR